MDQSEEWSDGSSIGSPRLYEFMIPDNTYSGLVGGEDQEDQEDREETGGSEENTELSNSPTGDALASALRVTTSYPQSVHN